MIILTNNGFYLLIQMLLLTGASTAPVKPPPDVHYRVPHTWEDDLFAIVRAKEKRQDTSCTSGALLTALHALEGPSKDYAESFCFSFIQNIVTLKDIQTQVKTLYNTVTAPPSIVTETVESVVIQHATAYRSISMFQQAQAGKRQVDYPEWLSEESETGLISSACSCYLTTLPPIATTIAHHKTRIIEKTTTAPAKASKTHTVTSVTTNIIVETTVPIYCIDGCITDYKDQVFLDSGPSDILTGENCREKCLQSSSCKSFLYGGMPGITNVICAGFSTGVAEKYNPASPGREECGWFKLGDRRCEVPSGPVDSSKKMLSKMAALAARGEESNGDQIVVTMDVNIDLEYLGGTEPMRSHQEKRE